MEKQVPVSWIRGKCIGKGSFGTVSIGVHKSDGRVFAVKSVDRTACLPSQLQALETEIRILRSLSSPCVVGYLADDVSYEGATTTTSFRNLHLEYLPGGTVADVASRHAFCSDVEYERTVRSLTWCLVSALRYVHARGIVHCDVKGKNVLVGPSPGHAKLVDFGSAIEVSVFGSGAPVLPRGSPLWMAPEVVRQEYQGPESDVWSLGCTLIEMVTGKPAWEDRGLETLSRIGFSDELPDFPSGLSETGRDFLEKCLRRDRSQRWSCDRLLEHPFLASSAVAEEPDSVANWSPRCVLDWINSEFDDEEEEDEDIDFERRAPSAKGRICKLETNPGENWESSGWTVVRSSSSTSDAETGGAKGEGIVSEYPDFSRAQLEIAGPSSEYSDFSGASLEYLKVGGSVIHEHEREWECKCNGSSDNGGLGCGGWCCAAGSSCRHGFQRPQNFLAAARPRISSFYSLYTFLFLLIIIILLLLLLLFSYYSTPLPLIKSKLLLYPFP